MLSQDILLAYVEKKPESSKAPLAIKLDEKNSANMIIDIMTHARK